MLEGIGMSAGKFVNTRKVKTFENYFKISTTPFCIREIFPGEVIHSAKFFKERQMFLRREYTYHDIQYYGATHGQLRVRTGVLFQSLVRRGKMHFNFGFGSVFGFSLAVNFTYSSKMFPFTQGIILAYLIEARIRFIYLISLGVSALFPAY